MLTRRIFLVLNSFGRQQKIIFQGTRKMIKNNVWWLAVICIFFSPLSGPTRPNIVTLLTTIINPPTFEPASLIIILLVPPNNQTLHK